MALALLAACADAPEASGPTPWSYAYEEQDPALLGAAELEEAMGEVLATLLESRPQTATDAFDETLLHAGNGCPSTQTAGPQTRVSGDCTTEQGWTWLGVGAVSHMREYHVELNDIDHHHYVWDFCVGNTQVISESTDERYELFGISWYRDWESDDGHALTVELWGEFRVEAVPRFEDTWIAKDRSVELYLDLVEGEGGWSGTWRAGFSRLDGVAWAFGFDDLAVSPACPPEPTGKIAVLDGAGTWYTVRFDGETACDGCGVGAAGETELGEVCADFSALTLFGVDPWEG